MAVTVAEVGPSGFVRGKDRRWLEGVYAKIKYSKDRGPEWKGSLHPDFRFLSSFSFRSVCFDFSFSLPSVFSGDVLKIVNVN